MPPECRHKKELSLLSANFEYTKFFKNLKMDTRDVNRIAKNLKYKTMPRDSYVIRHGDKGNEFLIQLEGQTSVWLPVDAQDMVEPLTKMKAKVNR